MEFTSDQCHATYTVNKSLTNHKRLKHGDVNHFNCAHCVYVTLNKTHLEQHVRSVHEKIKEICETCSKEFSDKSHLNRHKRRKHAETLQTKRKATETLETPPKRFRITQPKINDDNDVIPSHPEHQDVFVEIDL